MATRGQHLRHAAAFLLLACACGAATRTGSPAAPASAAPAEVASTPPPPESFDALAARAAALAPGMREVARRAGGTEGVDLVRADGRDVCVRVAFESSAPVTARLLDETGAVLASTSQPAVSGALGEAGPVCVRRGDVVRAAADGSGAHVRWMAWEAAP